MRVPLTLRKRLLKYPRRCSCPQRWSVRPQVPPAADLDGFTIIELLIALVISGILALSIFEVVSNESEFVSLQSQREEVQQNTRASLELIASELRTIPAGESLLQAST